jgi:hypothetical protein
MECFGADRTVKKYNTRRVSLAGFLASGFTILAGLLVSLVVVMLFADSPGLYAVLVAATFGLITLIPVRALQTPEAPGPKKFTRWKWRWRWRSRRQRAASQRKHWMRKAGQSDHRPFGTPELPRPSTFVAAPRKPTGP